MEKMRIASLFSGIGGFEFGINNVVKNTEVVFASEIDRFASKSYKSLFKYEPFGDITKIHEFLVPSHDLLVAGFPCQSFSIAGKRKGFKDSRGTLFFDIVRILRWTKPNFIILENVRNLATHDNFNTITTIINELNEIGYTTDFEILNSKDYGVAQSRERTYIVGVLGGSQELWSYENSLPSIVRAKKVLNSYGHVKSFNFDYFSLQSKKNAVIKDVLETKVDEKYFLDETMIQKMELSREELQHDEKHQIIKLFDIPKEIINDNERQRRVYSVNGLSPTVLARTDSAKILVEEDGEIRIRKLTPLENFRLQGFSDDAFITLKNMGISDTQLYKQAGNAVTVPVIEALTKGILSLQNKETIKLGEGIG